MGKPLSPRVLLAAGVGLVIGLYLAGRLSSPAPLNLAAAGLKRPT
jgi:hypothetical protein